MLVFEDMTTILGFNGFQVVIIAMFWKENALSDFITFPLKLRSKRVKNRERKENYKKRVWKDREI